MIFDITLYVANKISLSLFTGKLRTTTLTTHIVNGIFPLELLVTLNDQTTQRASKSTSMFILLLFFNFSMISPLLSNLTPYLIKER